MRTPKEYTDNLKKKTITESMLLDCLYSVNKRAKNYRDKERGYRQYYRGNRYAYDKYGNIDHCQVMKEEYYSQKEKLLSVLEPTCIHKEFIGYKRIRIYDYEPEYRKNLKNFVWENCFFDPEEDREVWFGDVEDKNHPEYHYYTHQCCEDFALMRVIPGMVVACPSDDIEAKAMVEAAYEHVGPVYMRFGRLAVPVINDRPDYKFELGKGIVLREGKDLTIIANGLCVAPALEAAEKLAADGVDAKVINIHTIKPLDEELVVAAAKETGKVVTVEEHSVIGGLGGAVCECLSEKAPVPVKRIGVNDVFGESGPATALLEKYGLDAEGIYKQIKEFV